MKRFALALTLTTLPCAVHADAQLERLEANVEDMWQEMGAMMVREAAKEGVDTAKLEAAMPSFEWDDGAREAGACALGQLRDLSSSAAIDEMLTKMEQTVADFKANGPEAMEEDINLLPIGVSDAEATRISDECGMTSFMENQMDSIMSAMMSVMMGE